MAKKTINQFGPTTGDTKAGAPGDEKPAQKQKLKKDGTPFKTRTPSGPRQVDQRITDLQSAQAVTLAELQDKQNAQMIDLRAQIKVDAVAANAAAKAESLVSKLTPEEQQAVMSALRDSALLVPQ